MMYFTHLAKPAAVEDHAHTLCNTVVHRWSVGPMSLNSDISGDESCAPAQPPGRGGGRGSSYGDKGFRFLFDRPYLSVMAFSYIRTRGTREKIDITDINNVILVDGPRYPW